MNKRLLILLAIGIALSLFVVALAWSVLGVSAHTRRHEYPKPCDSGVTTATEEANVQFEGGDWVKLCPTVMPTETPVGTPEATLTPDPTIPPSPHGDGIGEPTGDGIGQPFGDGIGQPAPTLYPEVIWK